MLKNYSLYYSKLTMETCSICLRDIEAKHMVYKLSCNHVFHFTCFKKYMLKTSGIFFVDCPNCRAMNHAVIYPFKEDYTKNLKAICSQGIGKLRCHCMTKAGLKCKKKSHILNYGMCQFHNRDILPKDKYEVMCKYIYHLLMCDNKTWETKISLMDFAKKLIIRFKDDIQSTEDIFRYIYIFICDAKKNKIKNIYKDKAILYNYYDLDMPDTDWLNFCVERRCIF